MELPPLNRTRFQLNFLPYILPRREHFQPLMGMILIIVFEPQRQLFHDSHRIRKFLPCIYVSSLRRRCSYLKAGLASLLPVEGEIKKGPDLELQDIS